MNISQVRGSSPAPQQYTSPRKNQGVSPHKHCVGCTDHSPKKRNPAERVSVKELQHDIDCLQKSLAQYKAQYINLLTQGNQHERTAADLKAMQEKYEGLQKEHDSLVKQFNASKELNQNQMDEDISDNYGFEHDHSFHHQEIGETSHHEEDSRKRSREEENDPDEPAIKKRKNTSGEAQELKKLQDENHELKITQQVKSKRIETLSNKIAQASEKEAELELKLKDLRLEFQELNKRFEQNGNQPTTSAELIILNEKLKQRNEQLSAVQKGKTALEGDLNRIQNENNRKDSIIVGFEQEIANINYEKKRLAQERDAQKELVDKYEEACRTQEGEKHELEGKLETAIADLAKTNAQILALEQSNTTAQQNLDAAQQSEIANRRIVKAPRHPIVKPTGIGVFSTISALGGGYFAGPALRETVTFLANTFCNGNTCYNSFSPMFLPILENAPAIAGLTAGLGAAYVGYKMYPDSN